MASLGDHQTRLTAHGMPDQAHSSHQKGHHKSIIPAIQSVCLEVCSARVTSLLLLLLYFTNNSKNSPGFEHLLEKAGRASFAVQGKIKKIGNIVPELMVRLGNIMIIPIVLFACQIWGVNLMDIRKGLIRLVQGYSISILTFFDIF